MTEIMTYKRKIGLFKIDALEPGHTFHCFVVKHIAPQTINSIGGKDYHTAIPENFNGFLNLPLAWRFGMYF
jgi:hypothetical protein